MICECYKWIQSIRGIRIVIRIIRIILSVPTEIILPHKNKAQDALRNVPDGKRDDDRKQEHEHFFCTISIQKSGPALSIGWTKILRV